MFKDYEVIKYLGCNNEYTTYLYVVKIIDDDFKTMCNVCVKSGTTIGAGICPAIIDIYFQKQLPVLENLALFILKVHKTYKNWSFNEVINEFDMYVLKFRPYKQEVEKILLFN